MKNFLKTPSYFKRYIVAMFLVMQAVSVWLLYVGNNPLVLLAPAIVTGVALFVSMVLWRVLNIIVYVMRQK